MWLLRALVWYVLFRRCMEYNFYSNRQCFHIVRCLWRRLVYRVDSSYCIKLLLYCVTELYFRILCCHPASFIFRNWKVVVGDGSIVPFIHEYTGRASSASHVFSCSWFFAQFIWNCAWYVTNIFRTQYSCSQWLISHSASILTLFEVWK